MRISDYLTGDFICIELKADNKEAVIKELGQILKKNSNITDFNKFILDVFKRESLQTTGIGGGIAIPHARTDAVADFVIAFGKSRNGLDFNSLDKQKTNLVFLMGVPLERVTDYLKILTHLIGLLKNKSFFNALLKAEDSNEIIRLFKEIEK